MGEHAAPILSMEPLIRPDTMEIILPGCEALWSAAAKLPPFGLAERSPVIAMR
jgi:hypothetical protein